MPQPHSVDTFDRLFDDAIDSLEITYDTYWGIDSYRPRCHAFYRWLTSASGHEPGKALVIGELAQPFTMLLEKLGYRATGLSGRPRIEPWVQCQNPFLRNQLIEKIKDTEGKFDVIVFDDLIQYTECPAEALDEFIKKLKDGGDLVILTRNAARGSVRLLLLAGRNIYPQLELKEATVSDEAAIHVKPYREYSLADLQSLLANAGLSPVNGEYVIGKKSVQLGGLHGMPIRPYLAKKLYGGLQQLIPQFRSHLLVVARKSCD